MPVAANASPSMLQQPVLMHRVDPVYRNIPLQGANAVRMEGTIDENGRVRDLRVVSGPMLLQKPAMDAVRQWEYRPARLNGKNISVPATIEVRFGSH